VPNSMTLPPSGYHARAMPFGCMAKGKGVSSQANLFISVKVIVGNTVSFGHCYPRYLGITRRSCLEAHMVLDMEYESRLT
jgi:hypothetical protein